MLLSKATYDWLDEAGLIPSWNEGPNTCTNLIVPTLAFSQCPLRYRLPTITTQSGGARPSEPPFLFSTMSYLCNLKILKSLKYISYVVFFLLYSDGVSWDGCIQYRDGIRVQNVPWWWFRVYWVESQPPCRLCHMVSRISTRRPGVW